MNKFFSTKTCVFVSFKGPAEREKSQHIYNWLKNETFQPNFDKNYFIINILRDFMMLCKKGLKISSLFKVYTLKI